MRFVYNLDDSIVRIALPQVKGQCHREVEAKTNRRKGHAR